MGALLITNIGELTSFSEESGDAMIVDERVLWIGSSSSAPAADEVLDARGGAVLPGFVDSHSHIVFAGDRAAEFAARMAGSPYTGGGIRTTVAATRSATDETLAANASRLLHEAMLQGTTTMEIKSGYGLTISDEARSLRIASALTSETTFLGAHIIPGDLGRAAHGDLGRTVGATLSNGTNGQPFDQDRRDYVDLVCGEMLRECAPHAKWIDVFCEKGAFDVDEARVILSAGVDAGLRPRIHANQLTYSGAVRLAVELDCASADHCTFLTDADVTALASSSTVATLLPGCEFSTRAPYPDARRLIDAGATVALATDCNPGSSFTSSMPFCIAVAVREMRMTPWEAIEAATLGGAKALRRNDIGHLGRGAQADLIILDAPSALHLAYRPGVPLIKHVLHKGVRTL
jgi:imidazolonepropionase